MNERSVMQMKKRSFVRLMVLILALLCSASVWAAGPFINYQGKLSAADGSPVNGEVPMHFSIWDDATQTDPTTYLVWEEDQLVMVNNGVFTAQLGSETSFPSSVTFSTDQLYLEVVVNGSVLSPRSRITTSPAAFWSDQSGNAATLGGYNASAFAVASHTHKDLELRIASLETLVANQQEQINLLLQTLTPEELSQLSTQFDQLSTRVDQLETTVASRDVLDGLVPFVSVSGSDVKLTGANLVLQNGAGSTDTVNGTGNLVIGYNAPRDGTNDKTGSHNLVIGDGHVYSSYGGFVAGEENSIMAPNASVVGGTFGVVEAELGTVLGGYKNHVEALYATVVGGYGNVVLSDGMAASILGGMSNRTSGLYSSIVSGVDNTIGADGAAAAIVSGEGNTANGDTSALLGGYNNVVDGERSILTGGKYVTVGDGQEIGPLISPYQEVMELDGNTLRITGVNVQIVNGLGKTYNVNGTGNLIIGYNTEPPSGHVPGGRGGSHNIIVGDQNNYDSSSGIAVGYYNYLGSAGVAFGVANAITAPLFNEPEFFDPQTPGVATVLGGAVNHATGKLSAMLGGRENEATGAYSAVVGGRDNIASGERSTVAGGDKNEAGGVDATIGGGLQNRAFLDKSAIPSGKYLTEGVQ